MSSIKMKKKTIYESLKIIFIYFLFENKKIFAKIKFCFFFFQIYIHIKSLFINILNINFNQCIFFYWIIKLKTKHFVCWEFCAKYFDIKKHLKKIYFWISIKCKIYKWLIFKQHFQADIYIPSINYFFVIIYYFLLINEPFLLIFFCKF